MSAFVKVCGCDGSQAGVGKVDKKVLKAGFWVRRDRMVG